MLLFSSILFSTLLFMGDEEDSSSAVVIGLENNSLSAEVLKYKATVEKYAKENGIEEYVMYLLAIMEVESGGNAGDVMQSSESLGLPPNTLNTDASIQQGCKYFASLVQSMKATGCDIDTAVQAYNFGGGFINYIAQNGKKYSLELSSAFAKEKSGGTKVTYTNPIAASSGSWRYGYGNQYYAQLVKQYLSTATQKFDDKTVQAIMDEALKYENYPYVFGGSSPTTSFDCSGLTQWCYAKAGITLPRTAQAQYDVTEHLDMQNAKAGDLVFFQGTYDAGTQITHVGIVRPEGRG